MELLHYLSKTNILSLCQYMRIFLTMLKIMLLLYINVTFFVTLYNISNIIVMKSDMTSHDIIIKSAKKLFWKYGIHKVRVEEICKEASISKMTFYRYFKNKDEVAEKVIENFTQSYLDNYQRIMDNDVPFKFKAQKLVELEHETVIGISQEFIKDIYQKDHNKLIDKLENFRNTVISDMMFEFKQAQIKGEIRKDLNLDFMLYMLNDINDKILDEKLNKMFPKKEDLIMQLTNFFFYGILP